MTGDGRNWFIQSLAGGEPRAIQGVRPGEVVLGWSADGLAIFVRSGWSLLPLVLTRLDLATGARRQVLTAMPPDPAGHLVTLGVFVTPDAGAFAFTYGKKLTELYLVEGLS